ncbi:MAG TPA: hypothetical protein VGG39_03050 [Polyangiaceae bacterium]
MARRLLSALAMSGVFTPLLRARRAPSAWVAAFLLATAGGGAACGGRTTSPGAGASGASGSGAPDAAAPGWTDQELGTYGSCTFSDFGFASGAGGEVTLTRTSSGALQVVFGEDAGQPAGFSLTFLPTSGTSAALDPAGQPIPWEGFCWSGPAVTEGGLPIDPAPTSVTLSLTSGALSYDAETLYLSVVGTPEVDAACEVHAAGSITCARTGP